MNASVEKLENNIVKLEITVEAKKFNEAMKEAFKKNAKRFNVPGFRKGKAPMNVVKRYYGEGVLYEDAINICCDNTYPEVVEENKLKPVDYPEIDIVKIGEGEDFVYTAKVTVTPEVKLGNYKGVEVKKVTYELNDEDVEEQLKMMQEKNARIQAKEDDGVIEKSNIAVIDFEGYIDGKKFEGGEGKDFPLEIGSGTFIDNFEDQLIGAKKGENKDIIVTFPEEYGREDLNGKKATFKVTVKEIRIKELPNIDDEFAKEVSEFDTIDELKKDIKKKIEESNKLREERELEEAIINAVCDNCEVDIPEVMINKEIDSMIKDLEMKLRYQGLDLETYYKYANTTEDKLREYMKESAERKVKMELVLEAIAKVEEIEASEEELLEKAKELTKKYSSGNKADKIDETAKMILDAQKEYFKIDVVNEKVIKMLVDSSKIVA